jgi:hypothetical protein
MTASGCYHIHDRECKAGNQDVSTMISHFMANCRSSAMTGIKSARLAAGRAFFLTDVDVAALVDRLDPKTMRALNIYGASRSRARLREELEHELPRLRDHVRAAANGGTGLLLWMI